MKRAAVWKQWKHSRGVILVWKHVAALRVNPNLWVHREHERALWYKQVAISTPLNG